jgi:hypothetical protein
LTSGSWCPYGASPDQALDQRIEAGGSLVFDTAPLLEPVEFLGTPVLHLSVAADKPAALVAVTLSEVLSDGRVTRLSYGLLNLTHRNGHEVLEAVEPGKVYEVDVNLNVCGQKIGIGSRLRVAISSSYWTTAWPSPELVTLSIVTGTSGLELPIRPFRPEDRLLPAFPPAETAMPFSSVKLRAGHEDARIITAVDTGIVTLEEVRDSGLVKIPEFGWEYGAATRRRFSIHPDDPLSAMANITWKKEYNRQDFHVSIAAETRLTVSKENLHLTATLDAYEGETRVFSRNWDCTIPRDHM